MKHVIRLAVVAGLLCVAGCGGDTVTVTGGDGAEVGVLVDGDRFMTTIAPRVPLAPPLPWVPLIRARAK